MKPEEQEDVVSELKRQLDDENLNPEQKISLLVNGLNKALNMTTAHTDSSVLTRVKSQLYLSGVLDHCASVLSLDPRKLHGNWNAAAMLAQLTSSCCVGVEPGKHLEAFHRLFLPSIIEGLLSLSSQLMRRSECSSFFRKLMDSVGWLLRGHVHLTARVLSSVHYERIQMSDDAAVSLLCVQLWIQTCTSSRDFVSGLTNDSLLLLLNEAICLFAVSADPAVGSAAIRLILLMAGQQELRVHHLLRSFRGLDSLLDKDWRGRGFDQDVDQLISFIQSDKNTRSHSQASAEQHRAACTIQAAWRSYQTRRRVKSLSRAVSMLQRRYRARRRQQQEEKAAERWEEELKYQVCIRRQQARRQFHLKQRQLLQLLPADQVQSYMQECERRAAVVIQSFWRGFTERRRYDSTHKRALRHARAQQHAARTLQRAVRRFLQRCRAAKVPSLTPFWIGQNGLTDRRRVELKREVDEYISLHPSSSVSREECQRLHEEVQMLLLSELQRGDQQRREEERMETLLAHTHTQLELLRDAPPLSAVSVSDAESFLSPSAHIASRAREAHNAVLQRARLPWWRRPGETDGMDAFSSTHSQEADTDFGGLFVGGISKVTGVDGMNI